MATKIEYEKSYLLKKLPEGIEKSESVLINDIYIPQNSIHGILRLRQKGDTYCITKKYPVSGKDSTIQYEHTIDLSEDEFKAIANCSEKSFVKRRYFMNIEGFNAEIDVYLEKLAGLVVAEFEFKNELEMNAFNQPEYVLADVSQDIAIAGGYLAGKSYSEIAPLLKKYGYKKMEVK